MKKYLFLLLPMIFLSSFLFAQKKIVGSIGFYNVENLFDTTDDKDKSDEEYMPDGSRKWNSEKYQSKQTNISKVIANMANGVDILGLAEVENLFVLQELVDQPVLKKHNYQIVHQESPDFRGIDCALLYKPNLFKLLDFETIKFPVENYKSRDILHVSGLYFGDTLHIYVNHWPSRRGGKADMRIAVAQQLRTYIDQLFETNPAAKVIVMGDLNDDPINKSVKKELRAVDKKLKPGDLFNASAATFRQGFGTLYYNSAWNLFDQIIVSQSLLKDADGITYRPNSFSVYGPAWMRQPDGPYQGGPKRTFGGGAYLNGFSDHFPTYILIEK